MSAIIARGPGPVDWLTYYAVTRENGTGRAVATGGSNSQHKSGERLPFGLGQLGIGVVLLGINLARRLIHKIRACGIDITLGTNALALGAAELFRSLMLIPVSLIVMGLVLLIRSALARPQESGATLLGNNSGRAASGSDGIVRYERRSSGLTRPTPSAPGGRW
ncbi:MAG TPA: hypothetical protein VLE54_03235 [Thermoanaerobaculia bacterium]|nr:hypothetical protein [Thermoanaerobaculia bacterium]